MGSTKGLLIKLSVLPSVAGILVVLLAVVTIVEIRAAIRASNHHQNCMAPPSAVGSTCEIEPAQLTEKEALRSLAGSSEGANKVAAVERLRHDPRHRAVLFRELLLKGNSPQTRIRCLSLFEECDPERAREGARAILKEEGLPQELLLLTALEVLSRLGHPADLDLFEVRGGETRQFQSLKEKYRDDLERRAK